MFLRLVVPWLSCLSIVNLETSCAFALSLTVCQILHIELWEQGLSSIPQRMEWGPISPPRRQASLGLQHNL